MKTFNGLIAGSALVALASVMNGCAPAVVASHPYPVHYSDPVPVQTVAVPVATVVPVVPVWAPPYAYVNQVHYYYFPDYMVYYNVFTSNYCYYNGYSWLHVAVLPSMPFYYGFSPYNSYMVVLNRYTYDPWMNHSYYTQQYPVGYYQTAFVPRTTLGGNTVLRAFDENESRPLYVDKRSNKAVAVQYTENPRSKASSTISERNSSPAAGGRTAAIQSTSSEKQVPVTDRVKKASATTPAVPTENMRSSQVNNENREKMPANRSQATPERVRTDDRNADRVRVSEERKPANTRVQENRQRSSDVRPAETSERNGTVRAERRSTEQDRTVRPVEAPERSRSNVREDKRSNEQDRSAIKSSAPETRSQVNTDETTEKVRSKKAR